MNWNNKPYCILIILFIEVTTTHLTARKTGGWKLLHSQSLLPVMCLYCDFFLPGLRFFFSHHPKRSDEITYTGGSFRRGPLKHFSYGGCFFPHPESARREWIAFFEFSIGRFRGSVQKDNNAPSAAAWHSPIKMKMKVPKSGTFLMISAKVDGLCVSTAKKRNFSDEGSCFSME